MRLRNIDLNFLTHDTLYATHGLHSFAAKCPPQLAQWAIERFTEPGHTVLDPMAGSGTALAEARLLGRHGLGMDIDPLGRLLSEVKSTPIEPQRLRKAIEELLQNVDADFTRLAQCDPLRLDPEVAKRCQLPEIESRDYWFLPEVSRSLALIKYHICTASLDEDLRKFFVVAFSSLILARTSVANARDIVHSRHHYFKHEKPPDVQAKFRQRLHAMEKMMAEFWQQCQNGAGHKVRTRIIGHDARKIPRRRESVDLVVTSPPYCNALDYVRAHALAIGWLQDVFGVTQTEYSLSGRQYIGTERGVRQATSQQGSAGCHPSADIRAAKRLVKQLQETDQKMACIVQKYFDDVWQVFGEMGRVLKTGRHLVVVVCPSHIRKVEIPTHKVFKAMTDKMILADGNRLKQVACLERTISERRRLLPYMQQEFGQRMQAEYVLVYQKVVP